MTWTERQKEQAHAAIVASILTPLALILAYYAIKHFKHLIATATQFI